MSEPDTTAKYEKQELLLNKTSMQEIQVIFSSTDRKEYAPDNCTAGNFVGEKNRFSVLVITYNEEKNIEQCLKSLHFADEIIVVDRGSTDATVEICKHYTPKVFHNDWVGFSEQRNFGLEQCHNDWVLQVDADEIVTPKCAQTIKRILSAGTECTWFKIHRKEHFNGRGLKYGSDNPSYQIRLFRRSCGRYKGRVHEYPRVSGKMGLIHESIDHYSNSSYSGMKNKMLRYADLSAQEKFEADERHPYYYKYFSGMAMFIKSLIFRKGFLDGIYGFYRAWGDGIYFYERQAKLWKLWQNGGKV